MSVWGKRRDVHRVGQVRPGQPYFVMLVNNLRHIGYLHRHFAGDQIHHRNSRGGLVAGVGHPGQIGEEDHLIIAVGLRRKRRGEE